MKYLVSLVAAVRANRSANTFTSKTSLFLFFKVKECCMKANCLLLVFILFAIFSCKKHNLQETTVNPPSFVALKLKDLNIGNLSSLNYHFDYTDAKHISSFNSPNGLTYDITYSGNNLTLMKNNTSGTRDSVKYNYTNDRLTSVDVITEVGLLYRRAFLTYYSSGQLQYLEWEVKSVNQTFAKEQSFTFSYYPDGNVKEITHHYFALSPIPDVTFTDKYENYDDKVNVDGFTLVHSSGGKPAILIPGITLQVNNVRRIVRTGGAAVNYEVNYIYTYDSVGRPLVKTGDFVNTSGPDIGQHAEVKTMYSYYK